MKPVDFRNETFADLRERLNADRELVHRAWLAHGPGTTREVSAMSGINLLNFRPRTTELFQMGLIELSGKDGHQGIYRARQLADWERWFKARRGPVVSGQQQLI